MVSFRPGVRDQFGRDTWVYWSCMVCSDCEADDRSSSGPIVHDGMGDLDQ